MKITLHTSSLCLVAALALAGCGSNVKLDEAPVVDAKVKPVDGSAAAAGTQGSSAGTSQSQVTAVDLSKTATAPQATLGRVVYFDFDSFVVKEDFRSLIEGHAKVLATNKGKRILVEGHTDERGGREYNLALGQKRAQAVAKSLALLGAGEAQVEAVSYGEERPSAEGHDEDAWAKNRRAELKDR